MPRKHIVKPGDCMATIARAYGFVNPTVIWDNPANRELKQKRKNPDILAPGDEVIIPDKEGRVLKVKAGSSTKLTLNTDHVKLRLKVADNHSLKTKAERYVLTVDGLKVPFEGKLKVTGEIDHDIPIVARRATLAIYAKGIEAPIQYFVLQLGQMDPIDTVSGVQGRLEAVGYDCGGIDGKLGPLTRAAILAFQRTHGLKANGDPEDKDFQKKLEGWSTVLEKGQEWPKAELKLDPKPTGPAKTAAEQEDEPEHKAVETICVRLDVSPSEAAALQETFELTGSGGYKSRKSVKDDHTPGDNYVDLVFTDIDPGQTFTLRAIPAEGPPREIFKDVGFGQLSHAPTAAPAEEAEATAPPTPDEVGSEE